MQETKTLNRKARRAAAKKAGKNGSDTKMAWRAAKDLKPGDKVITKDGRIATVKAVNAAPGLHTVHNFAVEDHHTYFVGDGPGIWVHNTYKAEELKAIETGLKDDVQKLQALDAKSNLTPDEIKQRDLLRNKVVNGAQAYAVNSDNVGDLRASGILPDGDHFQMSLAYAEAYRSGWDDLVTGLNNDGFPSDSSFYEYLQGLGASDKNINLYLEDMTRTSALKHLDAADFTDGWLGSFAGETGYNLASSKAAIYGDFGLLKPGSRAAFVGFDGSLSLAAAEGMNSATFKSFMDGKYTRQGIDGFLVAAELGLEAATLGGASAIRAARTAPTFIKTASVSAKNWQSYENAINGIYGNVPRAQRTFTVIENGKTSKRVADSIMRQGNRRIAVDSKFVKNWDNSIYNPNSLIGRKPFALQARDAQIAQARRYSNNFDGARYHTNSTELATYYSRVFQDNGIKNVDFIITGTK